MINQITCNSNNAIEMSRGELLHWLNTLLRLNYSKIQQMGTGAAYCQLLDMIYPGKVPLSKVNWKAKFDYEYLNNFKVLQQSFTRLNILKHIDVEKLVKCKYQDNLEFLQWFKKIFDAANTQAKEYDPISRRGEKIDKQNRIVAPNQKDNVSVLNVSFDGPHKGPHHDSFSQLETPTSAIKEEYILKRFKVPIAPKVDQKIRGLILESQVDQREFYVGKLKEIEDRLDRWDDSRSSQDLIAQIRSIILRVPEVNQEMWEQEEAEEGE